MRGERLLLDSEWESLTWIFKTLPPQEGLHIGEFSILPGEFQIGSVRVYWNHWLNGYCLVNQRAVKLARQIITPQTAFQWYMLLLNLSGSLVFDGAYLGLPLMYADGFNEIKKIIVISSTQILDAIQPAISRLHSKEIIITTPDKAVNIPDNSYLICTNRTPTPWAQEANVKPIPWKEPPEPAIRGWKTETPWKGK